MATDNLPRLARMLRASVIAVHGEAFVSHSGVEEETAALPELLRNEVRRLVGDLRQAIPNDFSFYLGFELAGVRLTIEFEDGNVAASAGGGFFTSRKSMLGKMRGTAWDERRTELLERTGAFDEMVEEAADRPVDIPSR